VSLAFLNTNVHFSGLVSNFFIESALPKVFVTKFGPLRIMRLMVAHAALTRQLFLLT